MTVSSTLGVYRYAGNGATVDFSFPARFNSQADLVVSSYVVATGVTTLKVLTTDYLITGTVTNGKYLSGGTVTYNVAPPTGTKVIIERSLALTQSSDYAVADPFDPDTLESDLDRLILVDQQQQGELDRAVRLPVSSTLTDISLPDPDAGATLIWNVAEDGLENGPTATTITTAITAAQAARDLAIVAQVAAEAALASTLSAYDNFDDRYLGSKASDPTLDNDGAALVAGQLYFKNTVTKGMRIYDGAAWQAAYVSGGDYVLGEASSVDSEVALFSSTTGKVIKRATGTGFVKVTSGVYQTPVATIAESLLSFTDIATNNASTSTHGFLKKLSNTATEFMNGAGNWAVPASGPAYYRGNTQTTIAVNNSYAIAHGLGAEPDGFTLILQCSSAELGYSIGDRVNFDGGTRGDISRNHSIQVDATNVTLYIAGGGLGICHKTTFVNTAITMASWKLNINAWRFS